MKTSKIKLIGNKKINKKVKIKGKNEIGEKKRKDNIFISIRSFGLYSELKFNL